MKCTASAKSPAHSTSPRPLSFARSAPVRTQSNGNDKENLMGESLPNFSRHDHYYDHGPDITIGSHQLLCLSGQRSDKGTIGGLPFLAARKDGLEINYTLPEKPRVGPG